MARIPRPPDEYFERLGNEFSRYPGGRAMLAALRAQFEPQPDPFRLGITSSPVTVRSAADTAFATGVFECLT